MMIELRGGHGPYHETVACGTAALAARGADTKEPRRAGRPSKTPPLRDIDPAAVADEVVRLVTEHATRLLLAIDPSATWSIPHGTGLRHEAHLLALYAQRGLVGDWTDHGCAADALIAVCSALYSQAGRPGHVGGPDDVDVDPTDKIGVVILAAQARIRIDRRQAVPVRELAALAGVDKRHVDHLGRQGEIAIEDGAVKAREARRFLRARGVEGI